MGRAPCCDKANVKKGPWSPEEDAKLKAYIEQHGTGGNWIALPQKIGLKRCGKSCRLRWLNYLRPNIKHGGFSEEEDNIICSLYVSIGSRWSIIAAQLPGRTDNDIKNYWNTRLKKKLLGKQRKEQQAHARRVNNLKQAEIKRECQNLIVPAAAVINQNPYQASEISVPLLPVPSASIQDYDLTNQASLTSLLTKLGGKFSDQHQQQYTTVNSYSQYPYDISLSQDQVYPTCMNMINPEPAAMVTTATSSNGCQSFNMFHGFENLAADPDLIDLVSLKHQQVDGIQGFYGYGMESIEMGNGSTGTSSTESTSWGDMSMSSLVYSPLVSDEYEGMPHPQDVGFQESRYFGMQ